MPLKILSKESQLNRVLRNKYQQWQQAHLNSSKYKHTIKTRSNIISFCVLHFEFVGTLRGGQFCCCYCVFFWCCCRRRFRLIFGIEYYAKRSRIDSKCFIEMKVILTVMVSAFNWNDTSKSSWWKRFAFLRFIFIWFKIKI